MNTKNIFKSLSLTTTIAGALLVTGGVQAQFLDLRFVSYGNVTDPTARAALDTMLDTLETQVNSNFPDIDLDPFTKGTAKATAIASSGAGADYASDFSFGYLGVNLALAMDNATVTQIKNLASGAFSVEDAPGIAAVGAVTLGLSFKNLPKLPIPFIDSSRARGYLSFFSKSQTITPDSPAAPSLTLGMTTFAAHGQYKLLEAKSIGLGMLKWNGVELTGGIRYTKSTVEASQSMSGLQTAPTAITSPVITDVTAGFTGDAVVGINSKVFSIPIEVSTAVRLAHVLGIFMGLGTDFNFGGASSDLTINSPIVIADSANILNGVSAQADALLNAKGSPGLLNVKYFGGVQFEVLAVAISLQLTGSLTNSAKGVNVGAKAFW
jgi:hypothetical protein